MPISLIIDLVLIVLLALVLFYAVRLNKQLRLLKSDSRGLESQLSEFSQATDSAQHAVMQLKTIGSAESERLKGLTERAGSTRDDLKYLLDRAERAADRMEMSGGRAVDPVARHAPPLKSAERYDEGGAHMGAAAGGGGNTGGGRAAMNPSPADRSARDIAREQILKAMQNVR